MPLAVAVKASEQMTAAGTPALSRAITPANAARVSVIQSRASVRLAITSTVLRPHSSSMPLLPGGRTAVGGAGRSRTPPRRRGADGRWSMVATRRLADGSGQRRDQLPDAGSATAAGRVLAVLAAFAPTHESLTLSEISRRSGLSLT